MTQHLEWTTSYGNHTDTYAAGTGKQTYYVCFYRNSNRATAEFIGESRSEHHMFPSVGKAMSACVSHWKKLTKEKR